MQSYFNQKFSINPSDQAPSASRGWCLHLRPCVSPWSGMQMGHSWTANKAFFFTTSWQISEFLKKWTGWAKAQKKCLYKLHAKLLLNNSITSKTKYSPWAAAIFWPSMIRDFFHVHSPRLSSDHRHHAPGRMRRE